MTLKAMAKLLCRERVDLAGIQETRGSEDDIAVELGDGYAYRNVCDAETVVSAERRFGS